MASQDAYPYKFTSKFWGKISKSTFWTYGTTGGYDPGPGLGSRIISGCSGSMFGAALSNAGIGFILGGLINAVLAIFIWSPSGTQVLQLWATVMILTWIAFTAFLFVARHKIVLVKSGEMKQTAKYLNQIQLSGLKVDVNKWWTEAIDGDSGKVEIKLRNLVAELPGADKSPVSIQEIEDLTKMLQEINQDREAVADETRKELEELEV